MHPPLQNRWNLQSVILQKSTVFADFVPILKQADHIPEFPAGNSGEISDSTNI
jgi:hypothetical protein